MKATGIVRIREGDPLLTTLTAQEKAIRYITDLGMRLKS